MLTSARTPPHNLEAEQALLGAILLNNRALEPFESGGVVLTADHFADPSHGRIYATCMTLIAAGRKADPVTVCPLLADDPGLTHLGGAGAYLPALCNAVVSILNAAEYARIIVDMAQRREMLALASEIADRSATLSLDTTASEIAHEFEQRLFSVTERADGGSGSRSAAEFMPAMLTQSEGARMQGGGLIGLATGLDDLDDLIGGLAPGNLIVVGARPAMGKSALMCSIAGHVTKTRTSVGVFSLEMKAEEVGQRLASDAAGIPYEDIRNGRLDDAAWARLETANRELSSRKLFVDDTAGLHVDQIRVRARRMHRRHNLGLLIIDHIHLLKGTGRDRLAELTGISASLKSMAREVNVPVLALCQLSRGVEGREDKRPQLSDLRESGSIEQDADVVAFLYRHSYYLERAEPQRWEREKPESFTARVADWHAELASVRHRADVLVHKNRHGSTGIASLYCDVALSRFRSLATTSAERGL